MRHGQQPWRFAQDRRKSSASRAGKKVILSAKFHKNAQNAIKQKLRAAVARGKAAVISSNARARLPPRAATTVCARVDGWHVSRETRDERNAGGETREEDGRRRLEKRDGERLACVVLDVLRAQIRALDGVVLELTVPKLPQQTSEVRMWRSVTTSAERAHSPQARRSCHRNRRRARGTAP